MTTTNANGSGDHSEMQAAAVRTVNPLLLPRASATPSPSATASSLTPPPPLASDAAVQPTATEGAGATDSTQIGVTLDGMDEEDAPIPPAQIGADFERMDGAIDELKKTPSNIEEMPIHPSQIAAGFDDNADKVGDWPSIVEEEETPQHAHGPATSAVTRAPFPSPADQSQTSSNPRGQQQIPNCPPPHSMMPFPDEDADPPVSALPYNPSLPMLEATPIEHQPQPLVYNAVQVTEQTRLEKNKKIIIGVGIGLLIGAVTAGVSISSNNGSSNVIVPEGLVSSTALPSKSLSPSQFPSLRPTPGPSQSTNPSQSPSISFPPSVHPSISVSPTPFCFGGEINILTDSFPWEICWRISRIGNVNGVANSKVILEGSPELEYCHTSDKVCLERGDYEFAIFDSGRDGITSPGYFNMTFDGVVIAYGAGTRFGARRVSFSLPFPSHPPSESSPPSQSPSASFQRSESTIPSQTLSPSLRPSNSFSPSTYWSSLNWNRQDLGFYGDAYDAIGRAMALSADASTMAMAAGDWRGRLRYVKIYHREGEGSTWEERGETIHAEINGGDIFLSLSADGATLSIGAPNSGFGFLNGFVSKTPGQVKVYEWDEATLDYVQIGDTLYGAVSDDHFGSSLDVSSNGKILAVGARKSNANGSGSGQVTVYAWDDASSDYKQRGEVLDGDAAEDSFGSSVSLSGNGQKLAVGAYCNASNGTWAGQVKIFEWDETTLNYVQLGDSLVGLIFDQFGSSVSLSRDGTALAIGAPRNSEKYGDSGKVKVFAWDEAVSLFEQIGKSLYGKTYGGYFGSSVVLSSTGKTLAVAAQQCCGEPGYVNVYEWEEAALEYKRMGQSLSGEAPDNQFGYTLALAGNGRVLAVGAPSNDRNGIHLGRVEAFDLEL